jgi:hypothetical protein
MPMVIEEIVFQITPPAAQEASPAVAIGFFGAEVSARLILHGIEITHGFVPICVLGPVNTDVYNDWFVGDPPSGVGLFNGRPAYFEYYRWILPKPLFVPKGWAFQAQFLRTAYGDNADLNVDVAFIGRCLPGDTPNPKTVDMPYATAFVRRAGAPTAFQSQEGDLKNDYNIPLYTQRFIVRAKETTGNNIGNEVVDGDIRIIGPAPGSGQYEVSKMFVPEEMLMDWTRRSWVFNTVMPPLSSYTAVVSSFATTYDFFMSLIGYREVEV